MHSDQQSEFDDILAEEFDVSTQFDTPNIAIPQNRHEKSNSCIPIPRYQPIERDLSTIIDRFSFSFIESLLFDKWSDNVTLV